MMAVLRPLRVVIDNYPEKQNEELEAENNPEDPGMGTRKIPFSRVIYIKRRIFVRIHPKSFSVYHLGVRYDSNMPII